MEPLKYPKELLAKAVHFNPNGMALTKVCRSDDNRLGITYQAESLLPPRIGIWTATEWTQRAKRLRWVIIRWTVRSDQARSQPGRRVERWWSRKARECLALAALR